jgi:hypothetical protein
VSNYAFQRCCLQGEEAEHHMTTISEYVRLQARCQELLCNLHVPQPYSRDAMTLWIEDLRGRPLILKELPDQAAGAGACGFWLGTDAADWIFYEQRTAPLHQEHIILHEIGHMLFGHRDSGLGCVDGGLGSVLTDLQPHLIKRLMARASYSTVEEQEAEMFASLAYSSGKLPRSGGAVGRLGALLGVRASDRR